MKMAPASAATKYDKGVCPVQDQLDKGQSDRARV